MSLGEFELIDRYFKRPARRVSLGVGDDCALLAPRPGHELAVSTDLLIEGRHFLSTVAPERLGHKALAVNLSDLAACGAQPLAFTLSLAMPRVDEGFLEGFSRGLLALADVHGCDLVGGDTSAGPLAISITVFGEVPVGQALLRSGARPGDELYVSGRLGDARLALEIFRGSVATEGAVFERVRAAMERPEPRIGLGLALRGLATAAIDVSDGLVGDLHHLLRRSHVGATLRLEALPCSDDVAALAPGLRAQCLLQGGDDYELLFTAPAGRGAEVEAAGRSAGVAVSCIGSLDARPGLYLLGADGVPKLADLASFDHFRD